MGARIMIVEDEERWRSCFATISSGGYEVETIARGTTRHAASRRRPDLAVLDWMLPGLSASSCAAGAGAAETKALPIIMLTARGEESEASAVSRPGDDYIVKPFSVPS